MKVDQFDTRLYRGGFIAVAVLAAIAVAVTTHPASWVGRVLGCRPLVWVGRRSYAIYLWFWPVLMMTRAHSDVPLSGLPLLALQIGLTLALAAASYRWVERPIRAGALGRAWREVRGWAGRRRGRPGARGRGLGARPRGRHRRHRRRAPRRPPGGDADVRSVAARRSRRNHHDDHHGTDHGRRRRPPWPAEVEAPSTRTAAHGGARRPRLLPATSPPSASRSCSRPRPSSRPRCPASPCSARSAVR